MVVAFDVYRGRRAGLMLYGARNMTGKMTALVHRNAFDSVNQTLVSPRPSYYLRALLYVLMSRRDIKVVQSVPGKFLW
jgi:hypothetical protein